MIHDFLNVCLFLLKYPLLTLVIISNLVLDILNIWHMQSNFQICFQVLHHSTRLIAIIRHYVQRILLNLKIIVEYLLELTSNLANS